MTLRLYNTLTRSVEEFKPSNPDNVVRMYCCGPTVYNYAHIGNLRTYVFEDLLRKTIKRAGFSLKHAMNITDVGHLTSDADDGDDKMLLAAEKEKLSVLEIARKYEDTFFKHTAALNIERPDIVCRATEHVEDMIKFVKKLEDNGYAYVSNGNVYYDTAKFPRYGCLSGQNREELKHGSRVEQDTNKHNPSDFVLWFTVSKFKDQILQWDSPWGRGYPGWHIECSTMAMKYLGEHLDIHCGGVDHIAVHHENEIAQSEGYLGHKWCSCWMHGEFLQMKDQKMSKSKGNFITLDTLVEKGYLPEHYRYLCLTSHYRSSLVFSYDNLDAAANTYRNLLGKYKEFGQAATENNNRSENLYQDYLRQFDGFMFDDLKTPQALAVMWAVVKDKEMAAADKYKFLNNIDVLLGLGLAKNLAAETSTSAEIPADIMALVEERKQARINKNWAKSDELRDLLASKGFIVKDLPKNEVEISIA